ncbi:MAG: DUF2254 family protein [Myxococcota bacterium]|nr:DUF2254 family protein [Myxococcota bacterium]
MGRGRGNRGGWWIWLFPLGVLGGAAVLVFGATFTADALRSGADPGSIFLAADPEMAWNTLGNLAQVVAAILGIAITVVSIVVQLAANRYTPQIADLFIRAPANFAVMGFFLVSCLVCVWVSVVVRADFVPQIGIAATVALLSASLLLLIPYFAYVFRFLSPRQILRRLGREAVGAMARTARGGDAERAKERMVEEVEQISDVALNGVANREKGIAMDALRTLADVLDACVARKAGLPARWFSVMPGGSSAETASRPSSVDAGLAANPDFASMSPEVLRDLETRRLWMEMKILRQFQTIFSEALGRQREIACMVAIHTRAAGESALRSGDADALDLVVKFMNTYLRATINGRDVRTGYNLLNEYRRLAEAAIRSGDSAAAVRITRHFAYYGQLAFASGLPFLLETAAYDLCAINEAAADSDCPPGDRDMLLDVLLGVDKESETPHEHEASLRGVRKAQVRLAVAYLVRGQEAQARRIHADMEREAVHRLRSIREELRAVPSRYFWEITDRGTNMDYIVPEHRPHLETFFGWFGDRLEREER